MSDGYQEQLVPKRFSYRENLICSVVKGKNPIKGLFPDASDAGAAAALLHNSARRICLSKQKAAAGAADLWGLSQIAMSSTRSWIKQRCSDAFAALERGGGEELPCCADVSSRPIPDIRAAASRLSRSPGTCSDNPLADSLGRQRLPQEEISRPFGGSSHGWRTLRLMCVPAS